jgi:general secretion pathway protein K
MTCDRLEPIMRKISSSLSTDGFTLVMVLWGLGILTMFALAIMAATRGRVEIAANVVESTRAELLSEAGIELWRAKQIADRVFFQTQATQAERATTCAMPDGAVAAVTVEDEGGKIDLNSSSAGLIERLIRGFGLSEADAVEVTNAIIAFARPRTKDDAITAVAAYHQAGRDFGPKRAPFETVLELDQVLGVSQSLFRALVPFVTVHNRQPGFDPRVAPPGLIARMNLPTNGTTSAAMPSLPSEYLMPSPQKFYLIHSEVLTPGGGTEANQAIVEIGSGADPARVIEHRRAPSRFAQILKDKSTPESNRNLPSCQ